MVIPDSCLPAQRAIRHYKARTYHWQALRRAQRLADRIPWPTCYLARRAAEEWSERATSARRTYKRWRYEHTLKDGGDWQRAVAQAQRAYPGTEGWLLSCSSSEGAHGPWVPNRQGSGAGGWLQFMEGTFWRMWATAHADVTARGFLVPRSAHSWYSPLGQALAGAWGVSNGRRHEWHGSGC